MGAAAITTSGFPIDRDRMADLLGFERPLLNSYGCIASSITSPGSTQRVKLIFLHLGRVIQDMAFWSAFEVGQLYVPNSPGADQLDHAAKTQPGADRTSCAILPSVTVGRCDTIVNTMHNTPFTDMNDSEGEVQQAGYAAFDSGGRVLALLTAFLPACSINAANVRRNTDAACITITELADTLVRDEGLSFRQAHEIAAAHRARGDRRRQTALRKGYRRLRRGVSRRDRAGHRPWTSAAFATAVALETFIARRDRPGGPAPEALDAAFDGIPNAIRRNAQREIRPKSDRLRRCRHRPCHRLRHTSWRPDLMANRLLAQSR